MGITLFWPMTMGAVFTADGPEVDATDLAFEGSGADFTLFALALI